LKSGADSQTLKGRPFSSFYGQKGSKGGGGGSGQRKTLVSPRVLERRKRDAWTGEEKTKK